MTVPAMGQAILGHSRAVIFPATTIAETTLRFGKLITPTPLPPPAIDDHLHPLGPLECSAELRIDFRSSDLHDDDPSRPYGVKGRAHDR
jgi:hypothetical protein